MLRAKPGMESRVEQELWKLLPPTRAEEGCINFDLHRDEADPGLFMVHENWVSEQDLEQHLETPYIQDWIALAGDVLASPMELTRWSQIG